jgi:hypothetical protein
MGFEPMNTGFADLSTGIRAAWTRLYPSIEMRVLRLDIPVAASLTKPILPTISPTVFRTVASSRRHS